MATVMLSRSTNLNELVTGFGGHGLHTTTAAAELVAAGRDISCVPPSYIETFYLTSPIFFYFFYAGISKQHHHWESMAELFPRRYVGWPATQLVGAVAILCYRLRDAANLAAQRWGSGPW